MRNVLAILFVFAILALVGCGTASGANQNLIGTWVWDEDTTFVYTFNDDGTGIRGWPGKTSTFTWSARRATLRIQCDADEPVFAVRNERWAFRITEDTLRLSSQQARDMVYYYIRN